MTLRVPREATHEGRNTLYHVIMFTSRSEFLLMSRQTPHLDVVELSGRLSQRARRPRPRSTPL